MYERFTDRARSVMQLANEEAGRLNHEYIGTEHILLGLIKEGSGVAANVLKNLDVNIEKVRRETLQIVQTGPSGVNKLLSRRPQTPRAKKVIEFAIEEARNLDHNYVGTEHLLLGLMREDDGVAAQVLKNLGLSLEMVRREVMVFLGVGTLNPPIRPAKVVEAPRMPPVPPEVELAINELVQYCRSLREQKGQAVAEGDFEKAAELREQAEKLIRFLKAAFER
jgi:ATP-dependent Clp protease ATP-binding subunit ClpA